MNMNEIKEMPPVELLAKCRELRAELFNLTLQTSLGTLEQPHRIGELRKDIARVETALSAKKKEAASA